MKHAMEPARLGGRRIGEGDGGRAMKGGTAWSGGCSPKLWENGGAAGAARVRRAVCARRLQPDEKGRMPRYCQQVTYCTLSLEAALEDVSVAG